MRKDWKAKLLVMHVRRIQFRGALQAMVLESFVLLRQVITVALELKLPTIKSDIKISILF